MASQDDDGVADKDDTNEPVVNASGTSLEAKPIKEVSWRQGLNEARDQMDEDIEDLVETKNNNKDEKEETTKKQTEDENEKQEENNSTFEGLFFFKENDERLKKGTASAFFFCMLLSLMIFFILITFSPCPQLFFLISS